MKKIFFNLVTALSLLGTACEKPDLDLSFDFSNINWGGVGTINVNANTFEYDGIANISGIPFIYYIYKDSATGSTDSVRLYSTYNSVYVPAGTGNPTNPVYYYTEYIFQLTNYNLSPPLVFIKGKAVTDTDFKHTGTFIDSNFTLLNEVTNLPAYWYPFVSSANRQYSNISSASIEGKMYYNIHCFSASNGLPVSDPGYIVTTFWWVKGTGIVKRELRNFNSVKTCSLLRYG